jgi:hypothetical protein
MDEKRKSLRARTGAVVSFKVQASRLAGGSRIKDISDSGICIPSKVYFAVGSILELEIRSDDLSEPVKTLARVVRVVNRDKGKFPFEVGLVFVHLPIAEQNMLHDYIRRAVAQGINQDISWLD